MFGLVFRDYLVSDPKNQVGWSFINIILLYRFIRPLSRILAASWKIFYECCFAVVLIQWTEKAELGWSSDPVV